MKARLNPELFRLAREFRGLSQKELGDKAGISQNKITRLESGLYFDMPDEEISRLARFLTFADSFFFQDEEVMGYGSSAYFYRKKAKITAADSKRIHALVNIIRINLKKLLLNVDIKPKRGLPKLALDEYSDSPAKVANALRACWRLPEGPISNLTGIMESAGIMVIPCDFGTSAMDATSLWVSGMPPLVFINQSIPGDRWRFTLAHELGHLVMHDGAPYESIEDEADAFASEFLVPEIEVKSQFRKALKFNLAYFASLKEYWKVSIGMLVRKALDLGYITAEQRKYFYTSKDGIRMNYEPCPLPKEEPENHRKLMGYYAEQMGFSSEDIMNICHFSSKDDLKIHPMPSQVINQPLPRLRLVK